MDTTRVELKTATDAQMRAFGAFKLGKYWPLDARPQNIRADIRTMHRDEHIEVPVMPEGAPVGDPAKAIEIPKTQDVDTARAQARDHPEKVKIMIPLSEEPMGDEAVPVGVNGSVMLIPRGEECWIPYAYFEALKHAVKHIHEPLEGGGYNPVPRIVPQYPFQTLSATELEPAAAA